MFIQLDISCYKMTFESEPGHFFPHLLEALLGRLPVDDIPDGLEVLGLAILVIKVVSVLPGINTQDWAELANNRILVRVCLDLDAASLSILNQPSPPAALNACQSRVELLLERIQAAVAFIDGLAQSTRGRLAAALACGRQVLPEQAVIDVSSSVEIDQWLQSNLCLDVLLLLGFGDLLAEVIERRYVGVVVVLVVQFHNLAGDGGFKRAIVVGKVR